MNNNLSNIIIDGHADTLSEILKDNSSLIDTKYQFNIQDAYCYNPYIQFLASFINEKKLNNSSAFSFANMMIDKYYLEYNKYYNELITILNYDDVEKVIAENKIGILLSIENGSALDGKLENVEYFYERGIRAMSLTWNNDNLLGCGAHTLEDRGITSLRQRCN